MTKALNPVILVFLVSTMFASGLGLTVNQVIGPFRNIRLAVSAVIGNYVLVPLIAVAVARLIGIEESLRYGLVLLSMTAGAEAGPKLVGKAGGDIGLSVGLLVASLGITMFYVPMMISLLLPGVHIDRGGLLIKLCITVAVPIIAGLFLKARHEAIADRMVKYVHNISSVFMLLMAAIIVAVKYPEIIRLLGSGALIAALLFIPCSFITGYLLGGRRDRSIRIAMAFMHGGRNASVALMIASQVFSDRPQVLTMITVTVVLMLVVLLPLSLYFGRKRAGVQVSA